MLGHAIDVTERVAAEQTLRRNQQALRTAQAELEGRVKERTQALEAANQRLAFLAGVSEHLAPVIAFEELLGVVRDLTVPFLADVAVIHLVGDDGALRLDAQDATQAVVALPIEPLTRVAATGALTIIDRRSLAEQPGVANAMPLQAMALLPLSMEGRVKAIVSLLSKDEHRFAADSI